MPEHLNREQDEVLRRMNAFDVRMDVFDKALAANTEMTKKAMAEAATNRRTLQRIEKNTRGIVAAIDTGKATIKTLGWFRRNIQTVAIFAGSIGYALASYKDGGAWQAIKAFFK
jgi:hypothetical protein